jgi:copper chaperone NosL
MAISDPRTAAQLVAPLQDPVFFDDIGCLRDYLRQSGAPHPGDVAYVADHRTGDWVPAAAATYTRAPALDTPMGSHLIAHADSASRAGDPASAGGSPVETTDLFGPGGPPDGSGR